MVRVRYAPSPTGHIHVGNARTAIFNYLYARHEGGTFIMRLDDTDLERSTEENIESMLDDIRWLGLQWDEGFLKSGNFGPYRETERRPLYDKYIQQLLEQDKAYRCFCTKDDIEAERRKAEVEQHFEQILARDGLTVSLEGPDGSSVECSAFDYSANEDDYWDETITELPYESGRKYKVKGSYHPKQPIHIHIGFTKTKVLSRAPSSFPRDVELLQ